MSLGIDGIEIFQTFASWFNSGGVFSFTYWGYPIIGLATVLILVGWGLRLLSSGQVMTGSGDMDTDDGYSQDRYTSGRYSDYINS